MTLPVSLNQSLTATMRTRKEARSKPPVNTTGTLMKLQMNIETQKLSHLHCIQPETAVAVGASEEGVGEGYKISQVYFKWEHKTVWHPT